MATGVTTVGPNAALDASVATVISVFKLLEDEAPVMVDRATQMSLRPGEGPTKYVDNYGRVVAVGIADGLDIANAQQLADTQSSYSPSEIAVQVVISGRSLTRTADRAIMANTGKMIRRAMLLRVDQDGCSQLASFVPIVGGPATVASPGLVAAAVAKVQIGNDRSFPEPYRELSGVFHPLQMHVIAGRLVPYSNVPVGTNAYGIGDGSGLHAGTTVTGASAPGSLSDEIIRRGPRAVARLQDVPIFLDANIPVDNQDDASGAVFDRSGLNYIEEEPAHLDPDRSDASLRGAVELNGWMSYTFGLFRSSNSGCEFMADASLPSS